MQASQEIRQALSRVAELRQLARQQADLQQALNAVKRLQAQRFVGTYQDLLRHPIYAPSANFFLEELYSAKDFSDRDAQFSRIATALERTFPASVLATVLALTTLHQLTEELDMALAQAWRNSDAPVGAARYMAAWRVVGQRPARDWQLATVLDVGKTLSELTRKHGLKLLLRMMRRPAELAGLGSLQGFLEAGFDHFSGMSRQRDAVNHFMETIRSRESAWIDQLFDGAPEACDAALKQSLTLAEQTALAS
jgi:hypothetical protein